MGENLITNAKRSGIWSKIFSAMTIFAMLVWTFGPITGTVNYAKADAPAGGWPAFTLIVEDPAAPADGEPEACPNRDFTNIYFAQDADYWYFSFDFVGDPNLEDAKSSYGSNCDETLYKLAIDTNGDGLVTPGTHVVDSEYILAMGETLTGDPSDPRLYLVPATDSNTYPSLDAAYEITPTDGYFDIFSDSINFAVSKDLISGTVNQIFFFTDDNPNNLNQHSNNPKHDKLNDGGDLIIVPVPSDADLTIAKSVDNATPYQGQEVTYTIEVTNTGTVDATGVVVSDVLDTGVGYVIHSTADGTYDENTGEWSIGDMTGGQVATLEITVEVLAAEAEVVPNTAMITAGDEVDNTNDDASADLTVSATPVTGSDLAIEKDVTANGNINPGEEVEYTLVVTNYGPDEATNIVVLDELPLGVTYATSSATVGSYDENTGEWAIASLLKDESATLTITATVDDGTEGMTIENTAQITSGDTMPDDDDGNDIDDDGGGFDVSDVGPQEQKGTITVVVNVTNDSNTGISEKGDFTAYVDDLIVEQEMAYDASIGNHIVSGSEHDNYELTIGGDCDPDTAMVDVHNNQDYECILYYDDIPSVDLEVTKVVDVAEANEGDTVIYTITVTNHGPSNATGVIATDILPAGVTYASSTASVGTYEENTGEWAIGDLAVDEVATLEIETTVNTTSEETVNNTVTVSADQDDPEPDNDDSGNVPFDANPAPLPPPDNGGGSGGGGGGVVLPPGGLVIPSGGGTVLGASTGPTTGSVLGDSSCAPHFNHFALNISGYQQDPYTILEIQKFLNEYMDAGLMLTAQYDAATVKAVRDFQNKEFTGVIVPWGIEKDTGHFYLTTQRMANIRYCELRGFSLSLNMPSLIPFKRGQVAGVTTTANTAR